MTDRLVSVVVPFYNNADLLGECLASVAAQTHPDLEVIMVDDGSTDGSAAVARAQAAADPRFSLVSVPNGGPGSARNHGIAAATGTFLAFADADDTVPAAAYATMLEVLERTGSDFASGGVLRLSGTGLGKSGLHARAIKARRLRTNISRSPELLYDISVWNKLFRRSFWDDAGLSFPEGMVWEDLVAMTRAHVLATAVDVITEPVYHWRDRDRGELSITQSRADIGNLRDRVAALGMIDGFLRGQGSPVLLRKHQRKALVNDLWLYVRDLGVASPGYQAEFVTLASGYLSQVSQRVTARLPATHKLAYYLISHGRTGELAGFARWLADWRGGRTPPMVRVRGRRYADLPLRGDPGLGIPARVFRPHWRDLDPYLAVDEISWRGTSLLIEGSAYVPSADIARRRSTSKLLVLVPRGLRRPPVVLPVRSLRRPDVTESSGQDRCSYEWAGFRCVLPARALRAGGRLLAGDWDCYLLVRGRSAWRPARLHTPGPAAEHPEARRIAPGLTLGARWAGDRLVLRLAADRKGGGQPVGGQRVSGWRSGSLRTGGSRVAGGSNSVRAAAGRATGDEASVTQSWGDDGTLMLRASVPPDAAGGAGCHVLLRNLDGWDAHEFPVVPAAGGDGAGTGFMAAVPVAAVETFGQCRPLRDGRWAVTLRGPSGEEPSWTLTADGRQVTIGRKVYRCEPAGPGTRGLVLSVGPRLGPAERGRIRRRLLREIYYRAQRLMPVREQILFSSFHGKQCGDSPGAIAAEMRGRGDARRQVWAVGDWSVPAPPGGDAVLIGTMAYFAALARSRYLVVNDHVPLPYRKRRGQRHVQTWHGTPLKRLGYDIGAPRMASGRRYLDYMAHDVAQWDLLLSPNPFSTPIMRRAFGFRGEICETGYPRDDALASGSGAAAAEIRRRLGLADGRRVAMYVPTWRDDQHDGAGRYLLDFRLDLGAAGRRLAADYVFLVRAHHLMTGAIPEAGQAGFALDVTGYPDIGDLLQITDVLITDYSSVMFDFAPTGRPMLFFAYDLGHYRDQVRGFYFDFEAEAPGPLLATSGQVVDALASIDVVADRYRDARAAFAARYCPLDDGKAAARACDRIFGG